MECFGGGFVGRLWRGGRSGVEIIFLVPLALRGGGRRTTPPRPHCGRRFCRLFIFRRPAVRRFEIQFSRFQELLRPENAVLLMHCPMRMTLYEIPGKLMDVCAVLRIAQQIVVHKDRRSSGRGRDPRIAETERLFGRRSRAGGRLWRVTK